MHGSFESAVSIVDGDIEAGCRLSVVSDEVVESVIVQINRIQIRRGNNSRTGTVSLVGSCT